MIFTPQSCSGSLSFLAAQGILHVRGGPLVGSGRRASIPRLLSTLPLGEGGQRYVHLPETMDRFLGVGVLEIGAEHRRCKLGSFANERRPWRAFICAFMASLFGRPEHEGRRIGSSINGRFAKVPKHQGACYKGSCTCWFLQQHSRAKTYIK